MLFSFIALSTAFLTNDFSVAYVAENSNSAMPWFYRLCAVWGAHEGSLLLWVFILTVWMALVARFSQKLPLEFISRVLSVMALIAVGFYFFILFTSNPFLRLLPNFPVNGASLNPLLQDPGLVAHPPMLYMGYVGFSVAFSFAIAALLSGKLDARWAAWTRPWTMAAWSFLTLGIVLGSWWSYRELGWGGWWFWDPVENASFMPWLVGTALIHSLMVTEKRDAFKAWTVLLSMCAFSLSLLGTFLVRSGILVSVHAFAIDPTRGTYILGFLTIVVGLSLLLFVYRANTLSKKVKLNLNSRETFLLINNAILFVAMLTVLLGTLYPLLVAILHWGQLSVGAPYFNMVFIPLMIPLFIFMGLGPYFYWQKGQSINLKRHALVVASVSLMLSAVLILVFAYWRTSAFFGLALSLWLMINIGYLIIKQFRYKPWSVSLAHMGIAITTVGIVLSMSFSQESQLRMNIGDSVQLDGYQFTLASIVGLKGPDYHGVKANVVVTQNGRRIALMHPEQRIYPVSHTALAKVAISDNLWRDLYVALGRPVGKKAWGMRIYTKPFVRWIWLGGLLMVLAGLISLIKRKCRLG